MLIQWVIQQQRRGTAQQNTVHNCPSPRNPIKCAKLVVHVMTLTRMSWLDINDSKSWRDIPGGAPTWRGHYTVITPCARCLSSLQRSPERPNLPPQNSPGKDLETNEREGCILGKQKGNTKNTANTPNFNISIQRSKTTQIPQSKKGLEVLGHKPSLHRIRIQETSLTSCSQCIFPQVPCMLSAGQAPLKHHQSNLQDMVRGHTHFTSS